MRKKMIEKAKAIIGQYKLFNGDTWFNWAKKNSSLSGGVITNNSTGQPLRGTNGFFHLTTATITYSQQFAKDWKLNFRSALDFRKFNHRIFIQLLPVIPQMKKWTPGGIT